MFRTALEIVKESFREYVLLNLLYYSLVVGSMAYTNAFPEVQRELMQELRAEFPEAFPWVVEAYMKGNFPIDAALTFSINLILGSVVYITLPSLIIPFCGIVTGCVRAVGWGLLLAPTSPEQAWAMIPHSLTLIVEGQGYILAMFAAYIQWNGIIWPKRMGEEKRLNAYIRGMKKTAHIYILVALVLAISAIYEAFEVIYIIRKLQ